MSVVDELKLERASHLEELKQAQEKAARTIDEFRAELRARIDRLKRARRRVSATNLKAVP